MRTSHRLSTLEIQTNAGANFRNWMWQIKYSMLIIYTRHWIFFTITPSFYPAADRTHILQAWGRLLGWRRQHGPRQIGRGRRACTVPGQGSSLVACLYEKKIHSMVLARLWILNFILCLFTKKCDSILSYFVAKCAFCTKHEANNIVSWKSWNRRVNVPKRKYIFITIFCGLFQ